MFGQHCFKKTVPFLLKIIKLLPHRCCTDQPSSTCMINQSTDPRGFVCKHKRSKVGY